MYGFTEMKTAKILNMSDLTKKNLVIAHPIDYIKLAESGLVHQLVKGGIKVIMSDDCEEGKLVVTGELAIKVMGE